MSRIDVELITAVYFPICVSVCGRLFNGRRPRQFAACLLSFLWVMCALLALQSFNQLVVQKGHEFPVWWVFDSNELLLPILTPTLSLDYLLTNGMPLEHFVGWVVLWGLVPTLVLRNLSLPFVAVIMVAIDCLLMPLFTASIHLGPYWLVGEAVAVVVVLLPALCVSRWTLDNTHLRARAGLRIATAALLFLYFIPQIIFAFYGRPGWMSLLHLPRWQLQLVLQMIFVLGVPGLSAVIEFASRGNGTPIPYDPPTRLVTSGVYRYVANPMQLSCTLVLVGWAALFRNVWLLAPVVTAIAYSAGVAAWDEAQDLNERFGQPWREYRSVVHNWLPNLYPYHAGRPASIYIARGCGPCSEIRSWLEQRRPTGLEIMDAESLPLNSIRRIRYCPNDGTPAVEGVRAVGRALEHLHVGWAFVGAMLRLPILWQTIQLLMDATGLGPRTLRPV